VSDLSSEEKAFLESVRDAWEPSSASKEAVRAGIAERLRAEPDFGSNAPDPSAAAAPPASSLGRARRALGGPWAIGTGLVVAGLCAVGLYVRSVDAPAPRAPESIAPASSPPETAAEGPKPAEGPSETVSVDALPNADRGAARSRPAAQPAGEPAPSDTLAEELALLRSAQASLRAGAADQALATLSTHASRFPGGALREERMTLQVLALCDRGDVADAKALRNELARIAPSSSHVQRLSTSCAAP
jgi:hypothetical protein